jgi:hypothetical protein
LVADGRFTGRRCPEPGMGAHYDFSDESLIGERRIANVTG